MLAVPFDRLLGFKVVVFAFTMNIAVLVAYKQIVEMYVFLYELLVFVVLGLNLLDLYPRKSRDISALVILVREEESVGSSA